MRSGEDHAFHFGDAASAAKAAAYLGALAGEQVDLKAFGRKPRSFSRYADLLAELGEGLVRVEDVRAQGLEVTLTLVLHDDLDEYAGVRDPRGRVVSGLGRLMKELGGLDRAEVEAAERQRRRAAELAALPPPEELLRALDAQRDRLLRYERVFVDTLRAAVAAGSVLDGQRAEAGRILQRLRG
jgi:hypothetical protein